MQFPPLQLSQDRRRSPRHATRFGAYFLIGTDSFAVNIQDYSSDGMFLAFEKASPAPDRLAGWVGMAACIDASQSALADVLSGLDANESIDTLEPIETRVMHASPHGLGVHIDHLPDSWIALLEKAGNRPLVDIRESNREYELLIQRCIRVYGTFSKVFAGEVLARTADRLGALEGSDPFAAARFDYQGARSALAEASERIIGRFVADGLKRVSATSGEDSHSSTATAFPELRLMQADELEDYLAVSAVIKRADAQVAAVLDDFEMRYIRLVGVTLAPKKNPFGPSMTLRSFREATADVALSPQSARILCAEMDSVAQTRFPVLLQDLKQMLSAVAPTARPKRAPTRRQRDVEADLVQMLPEGGMPDLATRQLLTALRSKHGLDATRAPRRVLGIIETLGTAAQLEAASKRELSPALLPADAGTTANEEAALPELLAAIDRLPMSAGGAFEQASAREVLALMQAPVDGEARNRRRLSAAYEGVLDTSALLFKRASRDFVPQSDVELLVKRLERTLLKLALRDGEFPSSPEHPARKVVNLIDQYNFAANDEGRLTDPKLRNNLDGLVTRICEQADHDATVFNVVQHSLEQDLEGVRRERRLRIDRIVEALESRDRVRVARHQVDTAISGRLSERRMPRVLIRLVDEVWRQHSVLIGLRHGAESAAWRENLLLIERTLAVSAAGIDDPTTLPLRKELYRELATVMLQVVSDQPLRDRLLADLEALLVNADPELLADAVDAPRFNGAELMASPAPPVAASPATVTAGSTLSKLTSNTSAPVALRVGDWWDMRIERKWIPVQLVWISQFTGHCGLVNRSASNQMELTTLDFQRQLGSGTARARDSLDTPLLDRSESGLLNEAYSEAMLRSDRDPVTGWLTRKGFQKCLTALEARSDGGQFHVVGLLECDQFRSISSSCGIEAQESLAKALSARLQRRLPKDCVGAVFRDDTFAVVMPNHTRAAGQRTMVELLESIADFHFVFEQYSYSIGVSAGVAAFGSGQCGAGEVLRRVDAACLAAKAMGRNRIEEYLPDSAELRNAEALLEWAGRADALLMSEDLYLRAQMVMPIGADSAELPYYEVLLGIEATSGRASSPYDFVVALERMGRSHELDLWVLRQAFLWVSDNWMLMESINGVSINLSAPSLRHPEVISFLRQAFADSSFPAQKIAFEITESAAIQNFNAAEEFIREIHRYGCRFLLDDFGSGFTSYAHLKRLSTDTLKIDGSYVKDLLTNASDLAIVKSMTDIAHTLGMKVVAEWVETPEILEKLIELGVDYAQGYAVHKPVRLSELIAHPAAATVANRPTR